MFVQFEHNGWANFNNLHEIELQVDALVIDSNHFSMLPDDVITENQRIVGVVNRSTKRYNYLQ